MTNPSSPLPWKREPGQIIDAKGGTVECGSVEPEDSEYICLAANSFHKMREALDLCTQILPKGYAKSMVLAALKASEGE